MATRRANDAVVLFRRVTKFESEAKLLEQSLNAAVAALDKDEFADYVRMTAAIVDAVEETLELAELSGWAPSTTKQALAKALNTLAGKDRVRV